MPKWNYLKMSVHAFGRKECEYQEENEEDWREPRVFDECKFACKGLTSNLYTDASSKIDFLMPLSSSLFARQIFLFSE